MNKKLCQSSKPLPYGDIEVKINPIRIPLYGSQVQDSGVLRVSEPWLSAYFHLLHTTLDQLDEENKIHTDRRTILDQVQCTLFDWPHGTNKRIFTSSGNWSIVWTGATYFDEFGLWGLDVDIEQEAEDDDGKKCNEWLQQHQCQEICPGKKHWEDLKPKPPPPPFRPPPPISKPQELLSEERVQTLLCEIKYLQTWNSESKAPHQWFIRFKNKELLLGHANFLQDHGRCPPALKEELDSFVAKRRKCEQQIEEMEASLSRPGGARLEWAKDFIL
jgi:hypothetical protein